MASGLLYIDPGTGSLLVSTLIGVGLTVLYTAKGWMYRITGAFHGSGGDNAADYAGKIVFFSEGKNYWRVYQPVIEGLLRWGQSAVYLSADADDPGLRIESDRIETHYLGDIRQAIFTLNRLKAGVCVMTTPQLDVIALRRSKHVGHYCHVIHSPTDIHAYKKFAFDFYDSVLCSSPYQMRNLRYLEAERATPPKELYETGCTYYDVFDVERGARGDAILLAPTWGDRTFFKEYGKRMLMRLLDGGYEVIFRPHPQSWISDKPLMDEVLAVAGDRPNFTVDRATNGEASIRRADVLICDITSGMVFDMAFAYAKPVVAVEFDWADGGYEASDLGATTAATKLLEEVGAVMHVDQASNIADYVERARGKRITEEIINKHIYNFKAAGEIAADQIVRIAEKANE